MLARDVGIRFKGVEKTNVEEYCVSEGWVRVTAGAAKDRYGNPLTIKVHGPVEPYFRDKASVLNASYICRHARACAGHPRLLLLRSRTWMAGTSPAMTMR